MKIGVLLSGNGVYDGAEIHEAVMTLLAIDEHGGEAVCMAPNMDQHHVVNHLNGEEMDETRNVLVEAARIARGDIKDLATVKTDDYDALMIPGGFGSAKNFTKWAFSGPEGEIHPEVKRIIVETVMANKPLGAVCMSPTTVAKALEGTDIHANLTVGTTEESSPYEIGAISEGMESIGATVEMKSVRDILVDENNKIVTAPCYMMEASVKDIRKNVKDTVDKVVEML